MDWHSIQGVFLPRDRCSQDRLPIHNDFDQDEQMNLEGTIGKCSPYCQVMADCSVLIVCCDQVSSVSSSKGWFQMNHGGREQIDLVSFTSKDHSRRWIGYSQIPRGVNDYDALWLCGICLVPSFPGIGPRFTTTPEQDKAINKDKFLSTF